MSVTAQESAAAPEVNTRQVMGAVAASCLGWALDLFDLFVLLYVAPWSAGCSFRPNTRCCRWRRYTRRSR
jgi:hypothetical protein